MPATADLAGLGLDEVRGALRLLGDDDPPTQRAAAQRALRETLTGPGTVRAILDGAPPVARKAFARLAEDGAAAVEDLLGRGWWGHGLLPPPLDWLQRRALVAVGADGLVHAVAEARDGYVALTLDLADAGPDDGGRRALRVEPAGCVVVAETPADLDRVLTVATAGLRALGPTVAVSPRSAKAVSAALRAAGVPLAADGLVPAAADAPALPDAAEEAVGPRAVRALLARAVADGRSVRLHYFASSRGGAATDRVVEPWEFRDDLLRGYCHLRAGERTFALDRIGRAVLLPAAPEQG